MLKRHGEKTIPDFIEDDFISALETGLNRTNYFRNKCVHINRISQSDENELGYDGVLTTIIPFYIQFKRSNFYSPQFKGNLLLQRAKVSLPVDKGFFAFELLKNGKNYDQHNTMFKLSQTAKAIYVAPKFYKREDLSNMKSYSSEYLPHHYDDIFIQDILMGRSFNYRNALIFKNSITIPPHAEITDKNASHHYSYCKEEKIGFHSEPINLQDSRSESLYNFIQRILSQEKNVEINYQTDKTFDSLSSFFNLKTNSKEYLDILEASINRVSIVDKKINFKEFIPKLRTTDKLLIIEDLLFQYFNIRQFIKYERKF